MATSTIPSFKGELLARLQARVGLSGVQVLWGLVANPSTELLLLGNVDGEQRPGALGNARREEEYFLTVTISVLRRGRDMRSAVERAWAIAAEVENELRDDASLGNLVRVAQIDGPVTSEEVYAADGDVVEGRVTLTIRVNARI